MNINDLIHAREAEAGKLARARGGATWIGVPFPSQEEREIADRIVKAGLTLHPAGLEGATVTEWGVRDDATDRTVRSHSRLVAERWLAQLDSSSTLMQRQRTTFPDVVTDWEGS